MPGHEIAVYWHLSLALHDLTSDKIMSVCSMHLRHVRLACMSVFEHALVVHIHDVAHEPASKNTEDLYAEYPWYGSSQVVDRWLAPLVSKLKMR